MPKGGREAPAEPRLKALRPGSAGASPSQLRLGGRLAFPFFGCPPFNRIVSKLQSSELI
jgi:hypothetical protein